MPTPIVYSLRIKIVSLRLRTTPETQSLILRCSYENRILVDKNIQMQEGLLLQNTSVSFQLNAESLTLAKPIVLRFFEKEVNAAEVGNATIPMHEFENVKMRKFTIATKDRKEDAYIQAFLLMLQSREEMPSLAVQLPTVRLTGFSKMMIPQSKVQIQMGNESCISAIQPQSPRSLTISSPTLKKIQSQEAETQTYNIESLLTLNSILEESNALLEKEKEQLQKRVNKLESVIQSQQTRRHIDHQYKLRIEQMYDQIEKMKEKLQYTEIKLKEAESKLKQKKEEIEKYQQQVCKKDLVIDQLKQKSLQYEQKLSILEEKQALSVKQLNIDEMMLELTKYSQTAKKYKNNLSKETAAPMKLSSLTSTSTQNRSSVKDFLKVSQRSQSKRHQNKLSVNKRCNQVQQTLDSMTESKVFF